MSYHEDGVRRNITDRPKRTVRDLVIEGQKLAEDEGARLAREGAVHVRVRHQQEM